MKLYNIMTVVAGISIAATSCNSDVMSEKGMELSDTSLEVNLLGVAGTRSVIQGSEFPNDSVFSVFTFIGNTTTPAQEGNAARVTYSDKKCVFDSPVMLPESTDVSVYAVYPYVERLDGQEIFVDTKKGIDYLGGRGVNENGDIKYANENDPTVNIRFEHILSRITLRIHRSSDNNNSYDIESVSFDGDGYNTFRVGYFDVFKREFTKTDYGSFEPIAASLSAVKLNDDNNLITADLLVIPSKTRWPLCMNISGEKQYFWDALPEKEYVSGTQYIYDCEISANGVLIIGECNIQPWENTDMPEVEPY